MSRAEMCGAGLSPCLRGSTYFFQADGQKNPGRDPVLREKRDPEVAKKCKGVANTLHRNRKALPFLFPLDRTVQRARPESIASFEKPLRPPAMFQVSFFFFMIPRPPRSTLFPYTTRTWSSRRCRAASPT